MGLPVGVIGCGGAATVYKATWKGAPVAVKACNVRTKSAAVAVERAIKKEATLHSGLIHPNVVQFLGLLRSDTSVSMVTELMDTSLDKVLWPKHGQCDLSQEKRVTIAKGVLSGLQFMQTLNP